MANSEYAWFRVDNVGRRSRSGRTDFDVRLHCRCLQLYVSGKLDGTDVVEKILKHCAIVENWREADGSGEGKSLFYYVAATKTWSKCGALTRGP